MVFDITNLLYGLISAVLIFFLKDIYLWIKGKISKSKPRISINFNCKWRSAYGTNPRNYKFVNELYIQNIDDESIYDIDIFISDNQADTKIKSQELLSYGDKIENKQEMVIQFGESGNFVEQAREKLPISFRNPTIMVKYKSKKGKKFSVEKKFN